MKRIAVLNGSYIREGNTQFFIKQILSKLPHENYRIKFLYSEDYKTSLKCWALYDISYSKKVLSDNIYNLEQDILNSDLFVIASPVYMHNISSSLKLTLEKLSTWAHTLRLDGMPTIVLSTCSSNGDSTVTNYLCKIITTMGGNIIANCNANSYQLNDKKWLSEVAIKITNRIEEYINLPRKSNRYSEQVYQEMKQIMSIRIITDEKNTFEKEESNYWKRNDLLSRNSFQDFLNHKYNISKNH